MLLGFSTIVSVLCFIGEVPVAHLFIGGVGVAHRFIGGVRVAHLFSFLCCVLLVWSVQLIFLVFCVVFYWWGSCSSSF